MVTLALMKLAASFCGFVLDLVPGGGPPSWFMDSGSAFNSVLSDAASMTVWFPLGLAVVIAQVLLTCQVGGGVIKIGRIVASFLTVGGGSAG